MALVAKISLEYLGMSVDGVDGVTTSVGVLHETLTWRIAKPIWPFKRYAERLNAIIGNNGQCSNQFSSTTTPTHTHTDMTCTKHNEWHCQRESNNLKIDIIVLIDGFLLLYLASELAINYIMTTNSC